MINQIYNQNTTTQALFLQQQVQEMQTAMASQYLGSLGQFPGPGQVGVQSLESDFYILTYGDSEFKGLSDIEPVPVTNLVHFFQLLTNYGSDVPAAVGPAALPPINQSFYQRGFAEVRFFADLRQLPLPMLQIESSVGNLTGRYTADSLMALAGKVEHELWHGNSSISQWTMDGLNVQIGNSQYASSNVLDLRGQQLAPANIEEGAAVIRMNWGPTNNLRLHGSPFAIQPLATNFISNQRVIESLWTGGAGNRFSRWDAQFGTVVFRDNRFTEKDPFAPYPKQTGDNLGIGQNGPPNPVAAPTVVANTNVAGSQWITSGYSPAGYYAYCFEYINGGGKSLISPISSLVNVAAGGSVTLTVPVNVSPAVTGIRVFRNVVPYTSSTSTPSYSDMQIVGDYPLAVGNNYKLPTAVGGVWTDLNADLPGTYDVYIVNGTKGAIHLGRLGEIKKYDLAPITMAQWFFTAFFGMLIVPGPQWHIHFKNVAGSGLPTASVPAAYS